VFIGKRLKEIRLKKGYTQQQLGSMVNVTKVSICCYEKGARTPNLETFHDLLKVLDITADYLLGMDINVICEDNQEYSTKLSKDDIEIINQLKLRKDLYKKIVEEPLRVIDLIEKRMK